MVNSTALKNQTVWETEWLLDYIENNNLQLTKTVIDVGCGDGMYQSNSRAFIVQGWNALLIDGLQSNVDKCNDLYSNHKDVHCRKAVLSDKKEVVHFKENSHHWSLSGISDNEGALTETQLLSDILRSCLISRIGILSLDIEGGETNVLKDLIAHEIYPEIIIVEGNTFELMQEHRDLLAPYYRFIGGVSPNQFFMKTIKR